LSATINRGIIPLAATNLLILIVAQLSSRLSRYKLTYNQGLDLEIADSKRDSDANHVRLEMLIDVYYPAIRQEYDHILSFRQDADVLISQHKEMYRTGLTDGTTYVPKLIEMQTKLDVAADNLSKKLIMALRAA
jgi:hypothetical protein